MAQKPMLGLIQIIAVDPTIMPGVSGLPWEFAFRTDSGQLYIKEGAGDTEWALLTTDAAGQSDAFYGDGSDGDVEITTTQVLARNMFYENLTLTGAPISMRNFKICVRDTLTFDGDAWLGAGGNDGNDGTQFAGGAAPGGGYGVGYFAPSTNAGAGGGPFANGLAGTNSAFTYPSNAYPVTRGRGGTGGGGNTSIGGVGGVFTAGSAPAVNGDWGNYFNSLNGRAGNSSIRYCPATGGGGGGGGSASGTGGGGSGGAGAQCIVVCARNIVMLNPPSGDIVNIDARGGTGGNGWAGTVNGTGGGGGGGGGLAVIVTQTPSYDSITVEGGAGGQGAGTGSDGSQGSPGVLQYLRHG